MVHLTILFGQIADSSGLRFLDDEAHFSCCAEIGYGYKNYFLKHCVFAELVWGLKWIFVVHLWFIVAARVGVTATHGAFILIFANRWKFIDAHKTQMHHITDIQIVDPVVSLAHTEIVSDWDLELLYALHLGDILQVLKTDVEKVSLCHKVIFAVSLEKFDVTLFGSDFAIYHLLESMDLGGELA